MAFIGFASVNIRQVLPHTPLPVILATIPRDYVMYAARDFINTHPGSFISMTQTANTIGLSDPTAPKNDTTLLVQTSFSDEDVVWYLERKQINNKQLVDLIDGNIELVREAHIAYPHMEYFISSLNSGVRMKKPVTIVQPCIMVATFNNRILELELPTPVVEYVLHKTPLYGRWLEQHVDKFYELLRRYK